MGGRERYRLPNVKGEKEKRARTTGWKEKKMSAKTGEVMLGGQTNKIATVVRFQFVVDQDRLFIRTAVVYFKCLLR